MKRDSTSRVEPSLHSRIRALRLLQKLTLKDVAGQCGFTVSLLSKIECGKSSPPVATLTRIAAALGVSLSDLLESPHSHATVMTQNAKLRLKPASVSDKGYSFHLLAAERADKLMQPIIFVARRGKIRAGRLSHRGEEFIYILQGRLRYSVSEVSYILGPGDSLYFNAEETHDLEPLTDEVRYLAVLTQR